MVAWLKLVSNCWMVCCPTIKGFVQRSVPNSGGMVCIGLSLLVTNMVHGVGSTFVGWYISLNEVTNKYRQVHRVLDQVVAGGWCTLALLHPVEPRQWYKEAVCRARPNLEEKPPKTYLLPAYYPAFCQNHHHRQPHRPPTALSSLWLSSSLWIHYWSYLV